MSLVLGRGCAASGTHELQAGPGAGMGKATHLDPFLAALIAKAINTKTNQHKASKKSKKNRGILLSSWKETDEHNQIIDGERSEGDHPL